MKDWSMVRITRKTHRRLQAFREMQLEQREKGKVDLDDSGKPGGGLPTIDSIVNLLLDRDEKHRARARKQSNKKKGYSADPAIVVAAGAELDDNPTIELTPAGVAELDQVAALRRDQGRPLLCPLCGGVLDRLFPIGSRKLVLTNCRQCGWKQEEEVE